MLLRRVFYVASFVASVPVVFAVPPNTTAVNAVSYEVGQGWVSHFFDEGAQNRWFKFTTSPGRSYCVEVAQGSDSPFAMDPNLTIYNEAAGTTQLATNNTGAMEPPMTSGARHCFIAAGTARMVRALKVNVPVAAGSGDNGFMRTRVYETTAYGTFSVLWNIDTQEWKCGTFGVVNHSDTAVAMRLTAHKHGQATAVYDSGATSVSAGPYGWEGAQHCPPYNTTWENYSIAVRIAIAAPISSAIRPTVVSDLRDGSVSQASRTAAPAPGTLVFEPAPPHSPNRTALPVFQ